MAFVANTYPFGLRLCTFRRRKETRWVVGMAAGAVELFLGQRRDSNSPIRGVSGSETIFAVGVSLYQ